MRRKDDLFELVHSLTPTELRYVKLSLNSTRKKETAYGKIIDAIKKQTEYDENSLKQTFSNESFVKKLDVKKYYLHKAILKALISFNYKYHSEDKIVAEIEMLLEKKLHEQAYRLLESALKKSRVNETFLLTIRLLNLKERLSIYFDEIDRDELMEQSQHSLSVYQNFFFYKQLNNRTRNQIQKYTFLRSSEQEQLFLGNVNFTELREVNPPLSMRAEHLFYDIMFRYFAVLSLWEEAFEQLEHQNSLLLEMSTKTPDFKSKMLYNLVNLFFTSVGIKDFQRTTFWKRKMLDYSESSDIDSSYYEIGYGPQLYELILLNKTKQLDQLEDGIEKTIAFLEAKPQSRRLSQRAIFLISFEIAKSYFLLKDFKNASTWNYKVLYQTQNTSFNQDLYAFTSIFNIIIDYERNEFTLLDSNVVNLKRHLKKRDLLYDFENTFLSFAQRRFPGSNNEKELFKDLKNELEPLISGRYGKAVLNYFDFPDWIESKL